MSLTELVYAKLTTDSQLNTLGITPANVWQSQTVDAIDADVKLFILITWRDRYPGVKGQRGAGRSYEQLVDFFIYSRERDWDPIRLIAQRLQVMADEIVAVSTGADSTDGWVSCVEWTGETGDSYDEVYEAMSRITGWTIIAKGA